MHVSSHIARMKKAEILSSLGAGILGAGIALLLLNQLAPYAMPILLIGLITHLMGMSRKHELEQQGESVHLWWADAVYWLCWLVLAILLLWIVPRVF
jgi:hypothetical protein